MLARGEPRLSVVVKPMDWALTACKLLLFPALVLGGTVQGVGALRGSVTALPWTSLLAVAAALLLAASAGLLQAEPLGRRIDRSFARLRRRISLACNHDFASAHATGGVACRLTPDALRAPVFRYDGQREAVDALAAACAVAERGEYWFVEGDSGSGKTRTALLLVQRLVRDLSTCELGSRCVFYDFAESIAMQGRFVEAIGGGRHEQSLVIVDNFQSVERDALRALTRQFVERPKDIAPQFVVFLARPDAWKGSLGADVRLLSAAKAERRHRALLGTQTESVTRSVDARNPSAARLIRALDDGTIATAAQLHLGQVVARHDDVPQDVIDVIRLLGGDDEPAERRPDLVDALGVVCALSVHRGSFSWRDVGRAMLLGTGPRPALRPRVAAAARRARVFRQLSRAGLVERINLDGTRFWFHADIAEVCIDRLGTLGPFRTSFEAVARARLNMLCAAGEAGAAWCLSAELGDQDLLSQTFDGAVAGGGYKRMASILQRAGRRYALEPPQRLQLAILLDRSGDFAGSRAVVTDELVEALSSSTDLGASLAAIRIEASHDAPAEAAVAALQSHPDRRIALVGEYWELHMAAHRGRFNAPRLAELAAEQMDLLRTETSHWLTYSLARMRFDSLRHLYLSGTASAASVNSPEAASIDDFLRGRVPTFEALKILYREAHLVGHVLLPRLALRFQPPTPAEVLAAQISVADAESVDGLVTATQRLYRRAREEFWQYGDREASYLLAEVLNADMIDKDADLDSFPTRLAEYEQFIRDTGFVDLASYPHLYRLRWHMLMHYRALSRAPVDERAADEHRAAAAGHLAAVVKADHACGNGYGLARAEVLGALLAAVGGQVDGEALRRLQRKMTRRGYRTEEAVLQDLRDGMLIGQLRAVFRFYPFVQQ